MDLFIAPTGKNFNFKNSQRRTAAILKTVKSTYVYNRSADFDKI